MDRFSRVAVAAVLLAQLLVLGTTSLTVTDLVALTVVLLAALVAVTWVSTAETAGHTRAALARAEAVPALRGRVTDPAHHPQAPRAPGQV